MMDKFSQVNLPKERSSFGLLSFSVQFTVSKLIRQNEFYTRRQLRIEYSNPTAM